MNARHWRKTSRATRLHSWALYMEIHLAERRVKGLTTMIANLKDKKATIEAEQKRLADELSNGRGNADAIRDQIRSSTFSFNQSSPHWQTRMLN